MSNDINTGNRTARRARHRRRSATQAATALAVITAALASGIALSPSAFADPIQGGVTGDSAQEGVTGGDTPSGTIAPTPAPEPGYVPETPAEPVYWVDPPAEYQNIEYQPLPNYDYDTNAYVEPEDYVEPVQFDQLHLPSPVEPTKPFIAPRDTLRIGEIHIKQPNWVSDMDRDRTNNTMAVVQAGVSTGWRSIGVETSRADRIAAAQVGAGAAGAALGATAAGGAAATAGALVGGTIGGLAGMTAGNVFLPGLGWVPAGIVGTAAGAGLGAAVGIPVAAAGAVVGGAVAVAAVTPIAAGDKGEPREIEVPDIDSEGVTARTETVLADWENSGPMGQAAAGAVQDTVEAAPAIDQQARDFVAAQPGGEQIIEQVDGALNSFFTDVTPGLAGNLLSNAIGRGVPAAN